MQAREATTSNRSRFPRSDLLLLALQIAVPVGVVDLIGGGGPLSALSIFSVPFLDWAAIVRAVWAQLVLNRSSRGMIRCR